MAKNIESYLASSGRNIKEDDNITNVADRMDELLGQSGKVIGLTGDLVSDPKNHFVTIHFATGGTFTAITEDELTGDPTTITFPANSFYHGKITSFTTDTIVVAYKGSKGV